MSQRTRVHNIHGTLPRTGLLALVAMRVLIGWHLLYEGLVKLVSPEWSSAGYLSSSRWILSDLFHWMASNPSVLEAVDFLNIWGLILIGLGLVLGLFSRLSAAGGALLLILYYVAHPPFAQLDFGMPVEGSYLIVNKTLVESLALVALAVFPTGEYLGLDRFFGLLGRKRPTGEPVREEEGSQPEEPGPSTARREILAGLATMPVLGAFSYACARSPKSEDMDGLTGATITFNNPSLKDLEGELPKGRIGDLLMSRVIMGNNLIGGWAHARDLIYASTLFKAYNNEAKVFETIYTAERAGIDMLNLVADQYPLFHKYVKATGGKMQTMCQVRPTVDDLRTDIDKAIDYGATTLYVQGGSCDIMVRDGHLDAVGEALDYIRSQGYVAGIGAHSIVTVKKCHEAGFDPDYYVKTCHHDRYWSAIPRENREEFCIFSGNQSDHDKFHDNIWDLYPEQTIEFMKTIDRPWVAFKILAGGAIQPKDGFRYAFKNGADFVCVGMFDFQLVEDVNIAVEALAETAERERPWLA
jgi:uncharacterized membrane protein YphA (DoxX/SURF4 family)